MKKWLLHIIYIGMMGLLIVSCSNPEDDSLQPPESKVKVTFTLAMSQDSNSRNTSRGIIKEPGTGYENYIDMKNMNIRILAFDKDKDTFIEEMKEIHSVNTSDNTIYEISGDFKLVRSNFKLVVLANWNTYPKLVPGISTLKELCEQQGRFSYSSEFKPSATQLIPMYGIAIVTQPLHSDIRNELGNIYIMRAMAKIKVVCDVPNYKLESVTLDKYNTAGMSAPKGMNNMSFDANTTSQSIHINIPSGEIQSTHLSLESTQENEYFAYIPEFYNMVNGNSINAATLSVSMINTQKESTPVGGIIEFKMYDANGKATGQSLDIIRNWCYVFTIKKIPDIVGGNLKVDVETYLQWDERPLNPGYY